MMSTILTLMVMGMVAGMGEWCKGVVDCGVVRYRPRGIRWIRAGGFQPRKRTLVTAVVGFALIEMQS